MSHDFAQQEEPRPFLHCLFVNFRCLSQHFRLVAFRIFMNDRFFAINYLILLRF